jgi:hypothetical protein
MHQTSNIKAKKVLKEEENRIKNVQLRIHHYKNVDFFLKTKILIKTNIQIV